MAGSAQNRPASNITPGAIISISPRGEADTPRTIHHCVTSQIGQAYLEAFEVTGENRWLEIANSVCGWIMSLPRSGLRAVIASVTWRMFKARSTIPICWARRCWRERPGTRETRNISTWPAPPWSISLLPAVARWQLVVCEDPKYHWFDNFHTGYNLDSLHPTLTVPVTSNGAASSNAGWNFSKITFSKKTAVRSIIIIEIPCGQPMRGPSH